MPLSWNEIKDRALRFSRDWAQESSEDAEAKSFRDGFFHLFDRAIDAAYTAVEKAVGLKAPKLGADAERVSFLFERHQALTGLLPIEKAKRGRGKASAAKLNGVA